VTALRGVGIVALLASILPLLACATVRGRRESPGVILVAVAFAVSFVVDGFAWVSLQMGLPNMWLTYIGAPVQLLLLLVALAPQPKLRVMAAFFGLAGAASVLRASENIPETFLQVLAGAWIAVLAWRSVELVRYRTPIMLYCAGAIPFLLVLGTGQPAMGIWMTAWVGYQAVRVTALAAMAYLIVSGHPQLEVGDDLGSSRARARDSGARCPDHLGAAAAGIRIV
jgi:hypothetical protein